MRNLQRVFLLASVRMRFGVMASSVFNKWMKKNVVWCVCAFPQRHLILILAAEKNGLSCHANFEVSIRRQSAECTFLNCSHLMDSNTCLVHFL